MGIPKSRFMNYSKIKLNHLLIVFILGFLSSIPPFATNFYLPAMPQVTTDLSTNPSFVQLSLTTCLLGMALGQLVIGPYNDVSGRKIPLTISLLVFAASTILWEVFPVLAVSQQSQGQYAGSASALLGLVPLF